MSGDLLYIGQRDHTQELFGGPPRLTEEDHANVQAWLDDYDRWSLDELSTAVARACQLGEEFDYDYWHASFKISILRRLEGERTKIMRAVDAEIAKRRFR